jgi:hypothetical protein
MTNHGLIRADAVQGALPRGNDLVRFDFLQSPPETLQAGEVFIIPYRITALADFNPVSEGDATGGGCGSWSERTCYTYSSHCANGYIVDSQTCTVFSSSWDLSSCGTGGVGGSTGGGTASIVNTGVGGGGGTTTRQAPRSIGTATPSCLAAGGDACNPADSNGQ